MGQNLSASFDPTMKIAHNDLCDKNGFTLSAFMHNEIYFLPEFLAHYRALGVEKFVLLDDNSSDGSYEYAAAQSDVMLLKSDLKFNDIKMVKGKPKSMYLIWRETMLSKFVPTGWSLHLDLDEFVSLPSGMNFPQLLENSSLENGDVIWGSMIDFYPRNWSDITENASTSLSQIEWYFDGCKHLKISGAHDPKLIYSGARARLRATYKIAHAREKIHRRLKRLWNGNPYPMMGTQTKPILVNWNDGFSYRSSHKIRGARSIPMILPMAHYKFAPNFVARVKFAIDSGVHVNGSRGYRELEELYQASKAVENAFIGETSVKFAGFESFANAGISFGL